MFPFPKREVSRAESILIKMLADGYYVPVENTGLKGKVFQVHHAEDNSVDATVSLQANRQEKTIVVTGWINENGQRKFRGSMQIDDDPRQARALQFYWGFPYFRPMKGTENNPKIIFP